LLLNNGLWIADMRKPIWRTLDSDGSCVFAWNFPRQIIKQNGRYVVRGESEDWYWSRKLWELGGRAFATQKIALDHMDGGTPYSINKGLWGTQEHDEETRPQWESCRMTHLDVPGSFDFADIYRERVDAVNGDPCSFVEVGSREGKSASYIGGLIQQSGKRIRFDAIEDWGEYSQANWQRNLSACGVEECVRPVGVDCQSIESEYRNDSLDFVFLNAENADFPIGRNLEAWFPKLKVGGTIAGRYFGQVGGESDVAGFVRSKGLGLRARGQFFSISKT
jgi:hypothetical protein